MLRVLYAQSEEDLSRHGYDPFLLQNMGSMLAPRLEAQVIKTLIGIVAIVFRSYGTDVEKDLFMMRSELTEDPDEVSLGGRDGSYAMVGNSDDVVADAHRILRNIFRIPHPPPPSPTVRRQQQNAIRSPGPGVASASSSSSSSSSRPPVASALDDTLETVLSDAASVEDMIRGSSSSFPVFRLFARIDGWQNRWCALNYASPPRALLCTMQVLLRAGKSPCFRDVACGRHRT
jgi:hypothetical protein